MSRWVMLIVWAYFVTLLALFLWLVPIEWSSWSLETASAFGAGAVTSLAVRQWVPWRWRSRIGDGLDLAARVIAAPVLLATWRWRR